MGAWLKTGTGRRAAGAGALAALVWAALEPLDRRLLRCDYSDVAVLGKAVAHDRGWLPAGLMMHAANGAAFGLAYDTVRRRTGLPAERLALGLALAEHVTRKTAFPGYTDHATYPGIGDPIAYQVVTKDNLPPAGQYVAPKVDADSCFLAKWKAERLSK